MNASIALETQLATIRFWDSDQAMPWAETISSQLMEVYRAGPKAKDVQNALIWSLERADPYFVSCEMIDLIINSMDTFPNIPLQNVVPVEPYGWVFFETPLRINNHAQLPQTQAFLWSHQTCSPQGFLVPGHEPFPWHQSCSPQGEPELDEQGNPVILEVAIDTFGPPTRNFMPIISHLDWPLRDAWSGWRVVGSEANTSIGEYERKFLAAFWAFIRQDIVDLRLQPLSRAARRRHHVPHNQAPPLIKTVELRRTLRSPGHGQESAPVDWSCRWIVRGHWRNQYYRKTGTHRPKFIPPYVKGPEGQPLKKKTFTLYTVVR